MNSSNFLFRPDKAHIADASVVINLNATKRAADIIRVMPMPLLVTDNTCVELQAGARNGHRDYDRLLELIDAGLARREPMSKSALPIYESLIDGSTLRTLDDGEAATIASAQDIAGLALIDERKAMAICRTSFPNLPVISTVELLMHDAIRAALGIDGQVAAIEGALAEARMRVPHEHLEKLCAMIGPERAAKYPSLPKGAANATPVAN